MTGCCDVIYWCGYWHRRRGRRGEQLVIVRRAVDGVVDDGQLLTANEPLVARVTRETVHVKHEFLDAHHQLGRRDCKIAFRTPRLHVPPVRNLIPNLNDAYTLNIHRQCRFIMLRDWSNTVATKNLYFFWCICEHMILLFYSLSSFSLNWFVRFIFFFLLLLVIYRRVRVASLNEQSLLLCHFCREAMHKRGLCRHAVSVCLSVCSWIMSKRIKISSKFFHCRVATPF